MFWTCRATVCSLITSAEAISRLLFPEATNRRTSSSRRERPCASSARQAREIRLRTEALEDDARRLELQRCGVFVAQRAAGLADQHARPCDLVRRLQRMPDLARTPQRSEGRLRVALRDVDRALRMGDQCRRASRCRTLRASSSSSTHARRALSVSPTASMISTKAGSRRARSISREVAASARRIAAVPPRCVPVRGAAGRVPAAAPNRTRLPPCKPSPRRRSRPAAGGARPGDTARGLPPDSLSPRSAPRLDALLPTHQATSRPAGGSPPGARDSDR